MKSRQSQIREYLAKEVANAQQRGVFGEMDFDITTEFHPYATLETFHAMLPDSVEGEYWTKGRVWLTTKKTQQTRADRDLTIHEVICVRVFVCFPVEDQEEVEGCMQVTEVLQDIFRRSSPKLTGYPRGYNWVSNVSGKQEDEWAYEPRESRQGIYVSQFDAVYSVTLQDVQK